MTREKNLDKWTEMSVEQLNDLVLGAKYKFGILETGWLDIRTALYIKRSTDTTAERDRQAFVLYNLLLRPSFSDLAPSFLSPLSLSANKTKYFRLRLSDDLR